MPSKTVGVDYEALAQEAAGNHRKFTDFGWSARPDDDENWCIVYTHNRDSGLRAQSNAEQTEKALHKFLGRTVVSECHSHWGVGWVEGYAIRVYFKGTKRITKAFKVWCDLQERLEDYPVLDEEDYSKREYEATMKNIDNQASHCARKYDVVLPPDYTQKLYDWFSNNNDKAISSSDDQGGYPDDDEMDAAFVDLGWIHWCDDCRDYLPGHIPHAHCRYCNEVIDGGFKHPIEQGWHFCSMPCFSDGYYGQRKEDQ